MDTTFFVPITTAAALLNGLLLVLLTAGIGLTRRSERIPYGDGGNPQFAKRQRGHANGVEQIPIALILLLLAELQGAPDMLAIAAAAMMVLGRYSHAYQFWFRGAPFFFRPIGVYLTLTSQIILILWLASSVIY